MNSYIILFFSVIATAFLISCGDDTTVTNNNNPDPPTADDSTIKLYSPQNLEHFQIGDTVRFIWSKSFAPAFKFRFVVDSANSGTDDKTDSIYTWILDSGGVGSVTSYQWKVRPNHWLNGGCTDCFQYESEMRVIYFDH